MSSGKPNQIPTAAEQLDFLAKVQRVLKEGLFTSTYKFALLCALADLAVERGGDDGSELLLSVESIAEKFLGYYWGQSRPFVSPGMKDGIEILLQNKGKQVTVISQILTLQEMAPTLSQARRHARWNRLVSVTRAKILEEPLWRLQVVGSGQVVDFLYANEALTNGMITLKPGVAYCLRRFYELIIDLVRGAWLAFVRRQNLELLGTSADLQEFMFGTKRQTLKAIQTFLVDFQSNQCFYCEGSLKAESEVDHFVPWVRYPVDLGHNFVLAHGTCNRAKSDRIADVRHLEKWRERNALSGGKIADGIASTGVHCDLVATDQVTCWAYGQAERISEWGWISGKTLKEIGGTWRAVMGL